MAQRTAGAAREVPRLEGKLASQSSVAVLVADLARAHRFFNQRFFGGVLPERTAITLEHSGARCRFGSFRHKGWLRAAPFDHIAITVAALDAGPVQALATLLHEMAHQWNVTAGIRDGGRAHYHNQHFRDAAFLAGLSCDYERARGYAHTEPAGRARGAIEALLGGTWVGPVNVGA